MYCSKCGAQIADDACFCYRCGSAVTQNASQYNAYQSAPQPNGYQPNNYQPNGYQPTAPQPAASYNNAVIKDGVNVVYPDGHSEIGDITISATEIVFAKKSKFVRVAFGLIGSSLEQGAETLRFHVSDIAYGQKTKIGLNGNVYQITLRNGDTYKLCLDHPKTITYLRERFG